MLKESQPINLWSMFSPEQKTVFVINVIREVECLMYQLSSHLLRLPETRAGDCVKAAQNIMDLCMQYGVPANVINIQDLNERRGISRGQSFAHRCVGIGSRETPEGIVPEYICDITFCQFLSAENRQQISQTDRIVSDVPAQTP